jgi:uncharacterized protein (TIGR02996 family)
MKRNPALEKLIADGPEDREAHMVYADWLTAENDPLGEQIATSLAAEKEPKKARQLKVRARKLLEKYIDAELVPRFPQIEHRLRAWKLTIRQESPDGLGSSNWERPEWRSGLIRTFGMHDWPAAMAKEGFRLLADPICAFVEEVYLPKQKIDDLAPIAALPALRCLVLRNSKAVRDVKALAAARRLDELDLTGTDVTDLSPLAKLPALRKLYLKGTEIRDLSPLSSVKTLEFINLEGTPLKSLSALMNLPLLWEVWLYGSKVPESEARALEKKMDARPAHEPGSGLSDSKMVYGP